MSWYTEHLPSPRAIFVSSHSYTRRVLFTFLLIYLFLIFLARRTCYRDPTSAFFDPQRAYQPAYSNLRLDQANRFIEAANNATHHSLRKSSDHPHLCLGIASIARKGARYFKGTVGSVLDGLSPEERADIRLILFIAHTDPAVHPAYNESWLHNVADEVLLYDKDAVDMERIRGLETGDAKLDAREKGLFDYTYLLNACAGVGAPYVAMLEDDVLALDGWYHRTRAALADAERMAVEKGTSKWLYLRLFYTEQYFGWNVEEWPIYLCASILVVTLTSLTLLGTRHYFHPHKTRAYLPADLILLLTFICTPLLIALSFAAGRVTTSTLTNALTTTGTGTSTGGASGVREMPKFGCCSQGLVFPSSRVPELIELYSATRIGYVDMVTEEFADRNAEVRWAVSPSVLQHVGVRSSKEAVLVGQGSGTTDIWNFAFEGNEMGVLKMEHELQLRLGR